MPSFQDFRQVSFLIFSYNNLNIRFNFFRHRLLIRECWWTYPGAEAADGWHPVITSNVELVAVEPQAVVHLNPPSPGWINQADCVDMDCDGPKVRESWEWGCKITRAGQVRAWGRAVLSDCYVVR